FPATPATALYPLSLHDALPICAGIAFGDALEAIGYRGPERCGARKLSAFFELHIEQGPILEAEGIEVGAVTGVQGMRWYEVTIRSEEHTSELQSQSNLVCRLLL